MRTVTVLGASLAGLHAAEALRNQGFDGRLVLVGDELHRPYDRPPLSKDFLLGASGREDIRLRSPEREHGLAAEWLLGRRAVALDPRGRAVQLSDGTRLTGDGVVIATGARPRVLPGPAHLDGVHTLRTVDDAIALRAGLAAVGHVAIVGAGFIGSEVAASCRKLGRHVTNHHNPFTGRRLRVEHWTNAIEQAATAARTLLTGVSTSGPVKPPYFWSDQYDVRIQFAGHTKPGDEAVVVDGDPGRRSFTAIYRRGAADVAVFAMNQPRQFTRLRRTLQPATSALAG